MRYRENSLACGGLRSRGCRRVAGQANKRILHQRALRLARKHVIHDDVEDESHEDWLPRGDQQADALRDERPDQQRYCRLIRSDIHALRFWKIIATTMPIRLSKKISAMDIPFT